MRLYFQATGVIFFLTQLPPLCPFSPFADPYEGPVNNVPMIASSPPFFSPFLFKQPFPPPIWSRIPERYLPSVTCPFFLSFFDTSPLLRVLFLPFHGDLSFGPLGHPCKTLLAVGVLFSKARKESYFFKYNAPFFFFFLLIPSVCYSCPCFFELLP